MERIMSTRIDESVAALIDRIAREKKLTKKRIIEEAVKNFWQKIKSEKERDIFQDSFGAWKRDECVEDTVQKSRTAFNQSIHRHQVTKSDGFN
jgi:predicted transcriptional regulator